MYGVVDHYVGGTRGRLGKDYKSRRSNFLPFLLHIPSYTPLHTMEDWIADSNEALELRLGMFILTDTNYRGRC
jgi:hypothetical protein